MAKRIFACLLVSLVLSACTQSLAETSTAPAAFITLTPTLFLGSPVPTLNTPEATQPSGPQPLPTFTPLTQPTPSGTSNEYAVILVEGDDVLNIRSEPGVENKVIGTLQPKQSGLTRTGKTTTVDGDLWVEIQNPGGETGWVNGDFLTEYVNPSAFCSDTRAKTLLDSLETAVNTTNGELFMSLVSRAHGLDVVYIRNGLVANYSPEEAGWVFQSTYEVTWGLGAGSGQPVTGTFPTIVLPSLQDVFKNASLFCDEIKLGGATYSVAWPVKYANINFYSIHNPGNGPSVQGMDWQTWLAGIEYMDGQPYLMVLMHYQWEP